MLEDILYGLRTMKKNPGVTAVAVVTLALGIGVNTAMFSVVNAVLLRPLPYLEPDRVLTIWATIPAMKIPIAFVEYNTYGEWWKAQSHSFETMSAYSPVALNLTSAGEPERLVGYRVTAGFLAVPGVRPALGRDFLPEEDKPNAQRVAILSDRLWKRRFSGDAGIVGRQVQFDRNSYTVVGVLPPGFELYGAEADVWVPIAASYARVSGMPSVGVHARLKRGVTLAAAQAEIDGLCRRWLQQYPYPKTWGARVWPVRDFAVRDVRASVVVLAVAVGLVLLIACANVANLLLARAGARQREMAIRSTLGAGAGRLVRQLLTESALLAAVATALGLAAAWAGIRALAAAPTAYVPYQKTASIDARVLGFTILAAVMTSLLFGLAPALAAVHTRLAENLKEGGRGGGEGTRRVRFRSALVVAEVALALLLVVGATLTARSLARLQAVPPGFDPEGVLRASISLPRESYSEPGRRVNFYRALLERVRAVPGVTAAGVVSHLPFSNSKSGSDIHVEGAPTPRPGEQLIAFHRSVDAGYLPAIHARLLRGRMFDQHDPAGGPVAIINETLARRAWPGQDAVGKRFAVGGGQPFTVVGMIADMRQSSLDAEPDCEVYMPHAIMAHAAVALVVRAPGDPMRLLPALRAAMREVDKDLPLADTGLLSDNLARSTRSRRFSAALLGGFALLALLLAAIGIYGVISFTVARRTHEIGVRMALGAERGRIVAMVVGRALLLGGAGVAVGIAGGLGLTRLLRSTLYGVSATDPATFAGVSLALLAVTALAAYIPALRASRVDPGVALRQE